MDGTFVSLRSMLHEELQLWEELAQQELPGGMLPHLPQVARSMVKVVSATEGKHFEDVVLQAFIDCITRLRVALENTIRKVQQATRPEFDQDRRQAEEGAAIKNMIVSSKELQDRQQNLLKAIAQVQNGASGLRSRKGSDVLNPPNSMIHTREHDDTILKDMTKRLRGAGAPFGTGDSNAVNECISSIVNLEQRKTQFRIAEEAAQFLEHIVLSADNHHGADQASNGLGAAASMQDDVAASVNQWLSGRKRVYFLTGEPNTGKSWNARGLCRYLCSERSRTAKLGGSIFLAAGDKYVESFQFSLLSLSYQVAPQPRSIFVDKLRRYLYRGEEKQLKREAIELLRKSLVAASFQTPTVLVFDGIDQCKESDDAPRLLHQLLAVVREFPWLFLFLAARPRPNVMAVLTHCSVADIVNHRHLDDDIGRWKEDSDQYLQYTVPKIPAYTDHVQKHPEALLQLIKLTKGDVRFAQLATRYLDAESNRPEARFSCLLSIAESESPLEALYILQLESVSSSFSARQRRCLQTVMRFIAYTECGLTPSAISAYAHQISEDDVVRVVDNLRTVLTINHGCGIVPHDASFPRFLCDMMPKGRPASSYLPQGNQASHAASVCLAAISTTRNISSIPRLLPPPYLLQGDHHSQSNIPFLRRLDDSARIVRA
ncbi:AAA-16 domain-containing protein [Phanerochaete sordida]|uniref:AAA-16 domain-containing protein n=1 Tax=Phanerochaete sordida TaxID=48140 RepID=A0A9P3LK37_9APHY|nr:AAA-16 domain-containing protein [Phanerochaete sordida]